MNQKKLCQIRLWPQSNEPPTFHLQFETTWVLRWNIAYRNVRGRRNLPLVVQQESRILKNLTPAWYRIIRRRPGSFSSSNSQPVYMREFDLHPLIFIGFIHARKTYLPTSNSSFGNPPAPCFSDPSFRRLSPGHPAMFIWLIGGGYFAIVRFRLTRGCSNLLFEGYGGEEDVDIFSSVDA